MTPIINLSWMVEPPSAAHYLRFPAPQAGFFLLSGQEKETKEKAARSLRRPNTGRFPARLATAERSPNSPGAHNAPRAQSKVSRKLPALLGARLAPTGDKTTLLLSAFPSGDLAGFVGPVNTASTYRLIA